MMLGKVKHEREGWRSREREKQKQSERKYERDEKGGVIPWFPNQGIPFKSAGLMC